MGDQSEGSSIAAHSALQQTEDTYRRGILGRLFSSFSRQPTAGSTAQQAPLIEATPSRLMPGVRSLRNLRVEDVAIPKSDIKAVSVSLSKDELWDVFRETALTRLPVFDGTLDTPIGNVNMKDFALAYGFNGNGKDFDLRGMLRPLLYVPPSMPVQVLLQKMQQERIHIALVIDEYGGTDGLVTIEDLLEQIVGEIEDEHDVEEAAQWLEEKSGIYLALAKASLDEFEKAIGVSLTDHAGIDDEDIDTLGGLVFMLSGQVPARGEIIPHPAGVEFEVVDADPRRIKRLRVRMPHVAKG